MALADSAVGIRLPDYSCRRSSRLVCLSCTSATEQSKRAPRVILGFTTRLDCQRHARSFKPSHCSSIARLGIYTINLRFSFKCRGQPPTALRVTKQVRHTPSEEMQCLKEACSWQTNTSCSRSRPREHGTLTKFNTIVCMHPNIAFGPEFCTCAFY